MPTPTLPDNLAQEALDAWSRNRKSRKAAAAELGLNLGTFERRLYVARERGMTPKAPDKVRVHSVGAEDSAPVSQRDRIYFEDTIRQLRKDLREAHRADLNDESVRQEIFGLAAMIPEPPEWLIREKTAGTAAGVPLTMWSDWHFGEVVRSVEVGGVNEFNVDIARQRIRALVERTIDLCFNHMVRPEYPGIVVCLGGDMISGDIHQELAESNELPTAPTIMELLGILIWAISTMADKFGRVFLPCVVGNHGRMTHKPRAKRRVHTSFEWIIYTALERHFRDDDRVRFQIPGETDAHFSVYGHRYLLTHGDALGVKGGDGIIGALGPITRGVVKLHNSEAQVGRDFDTLIIGHWHQYLPLPGCIVNGALKGYDEYARTFLRARYQRPIQALWFQHPKHGITAQWPLFLDEERTFDPANWVTWAAPPT